ncbi:MAG: hypothetical protein HY923_09880 [Elusimicrobia bacterium]|nr:hypothetical protein [Elusimicrobiota bacterium]
MDPPKRDQSNIGSCHAFAAVAMLEAAYSRGYGHRLSEEDLFVQRTILTGDAHSDVCRTGLKCGLMEGNFVDGDIRHVLENQLCRIGSVEAVLFPSETETF